jgi:glycosyltransferase A (GT-A) superfamily protein (DUF2064 family)
LVQNTAILLFVQDVSVDASHKILTSDKDTRVNQRLIRELNHRLFQIAALTGLPVFRSDKLIKSQNNFGKDIVNATQTIFEKGFEKIICVGNDCPSLSKDAILKAANLIQTNRSVVGPDARGGVYLLGLSKQNFDTTAFEMLAWQSPQMLVTYFQDIDSQAVVLESLTDIHSFRELQASKNSSYFIGYLLAIIHNALRQGFYYPSFLFSSRSVPSRSLRGPPFM